MPRKTTKTATSTGRSTRAKATAAKPRAKRTRKPVTVELVETSIEARFLRDQIEKAAYGLFEQRGHTHGYDMEDWLEAEKIVLQRIKA